MEAVCTSSAPTRLHGATPQKTLNFILAAVRTWNLTLVFVVYFTMLFQYLRLKMSNSMVISEWWIRKDLEGIGRGLILR
jgi:hypothetical protein